MKTLLINYNVFALAFAMQFNDVAADMVLLQLVERNIQFSRVIFEINLLFKIQGRVLILDFDDKYEQIYQTLFIYVKMQQFMANNMQFTELF